MVIILTLGGRVRVPSSTQSHCTLYTPHIIVHRVIIVKRIIRQVTANWRVSTEIYELHTQKTIEAWPNEDRVPISDHQECKEQIQSPHFSPHRKTCPAINLNY